RVKQSKRSPRGPAQEELISAQQNQKFAHEAVEHRQTERRKRHEQEKRSKLRHGRRKPAKFADFKGMPPVVEHADEQEQRAGRNPVREHLENSALHGNVLEREDAEHHEAKVAD